MAQRDRDTGSQTNKGYTQNSEYNKQSIQLPLSRESIAKLEMTQCKLLTRSAKHDPPPPPANTSKIVSMIMKYHNHKLQTNTWHRKEEPHNNHETLGRQTKQSNKLSLPHQDDHRLKMIITWNQNAWVHDCVCVLGCTRVRACVCER